MSERDPNELGALWVKTGRRGDYMTGKIGDQPVVVFKNDRKAAGSNAPDWRVMKPVKQDREQDQRITGPRPPATIDDNDIQF